MKRFFGCILVAAAIVLAFSVNAVTAAGSLKIGYFDLQAAITQSETGKKFLQGMKSEEDQLSSVLEQKGRAFMSAKDEYEKKKDVMDEKARSRKEKELTDLYTEVQKIRSESSAKLQEQANAARAPIIKRVKEITDKIGKDDKYDFIFEKSVVYYAGNEKEDLTKRIAAELDKSPPR
ncbi:MAG: OmpH family outer membrane protein [Syntrophobacteraceae bacterium]